MRFSMLAVLLSQAAIALAGCDPPSPGFPPPAFSKHDFQKKLSVILDTVLSTFSGRETYDKTSFSIAITSADETLYQYDHTAKIRNPTHRGAKQITSLTSYRIASMTKPFTVLAILQLHKSGLLNLDDPILQYLPTLNTTQSGTLPWKDLTLRALASQLSGIPRDLAQEDLITQPSLASALGLPNLALSDLPDLPRCDSFTNYTRPCTAKDLLSYVKTLTPTFAPNQKSTYSNLNYDLLGLVISAVTNQSYESYVHSHILEPLKMKHSSFVQPPDSHAAIPELPEGEQYWFFNASVQNPTGGLYSNTHDLSLFVRHVMSTFNAQTHALNWFNPASFTSSINSFYGIPWEIYRTRTSDIVVTGSDRALTFITKGGSLPGYTSIMIISPDYNFGVVILVAGDNDGLVDKLREMLVRAMVYYSEGLVAEMLNGRYAGTFSDAASNSSLTLLFTPKLGLHVDLSSWKMRGQPTGPIVSSHFGSDSSQGAFHAILAPTLLYKNQMEQEGEIWKAITGYVSTDRSKAVGRVFENFCEDNWNVYDMGGVQVNQFVMHMDKTGTVDMVEASGFRLNLTRSDADDGVLKVSNGKDRGVDRQVPLLPLDFNDIGIEGKFMF